MKIYVVGMNTDIDSFWNVYNKESKKEYGEIPDYMFCISFKVKTLDDYLNIKVTMENIFQDCGADNVDNNYDKFLLNIMRKMN